MSTSHYHGHRERLRNRLMKDSRQLADYEILELLLGLVVPRRDMKPLAKELLERCKTLRGVFQVDPEQLRGLEGFGPSLESFWVLMRELRARQAEAPVLERPVLKSPQAVAELAISRLGSNLKEEFWLALVDNKNRLIGWERLSLGTVDQTAVYPREVLALALERKASGIIMVHNHPGGDLSPSKQDVDLTRRIVRAAQELNVRMLDHLIVTESGFFSFQSQALL